MATSPRPGRAWGPTLASTITSGYTKHWGTRLRQRFTTERQTANGRFVRRVSKDRLVETEARRGATEVGVLTGRTGRP